MPLFVPLAAVLAADPRPATRPVMPSEEVASWMSGTFDTKDQASLDSEVPPLRAVVVLVPASRISNGATVLYREEARLDRLERPVWQGFLRLEGDATGRVLVREFELKEAASAAGKWRTPDVLALFGKNDLRERSACAVPLARTGDHYEGSSPEPGCALPLLGAIRSKLEIRVWPGRTETWERGFDGKGEQVWGPKKGPIRWEKRSPLPPGESADAAGGP